jgi:hypothetical protein
MKLLRDNWWAAAIVILGIAVAVAVVWPITDLIAAHDVGWMTGPARGMHLQAAREAVRTEMPTLGAGAFALSAVVYTGLNPGTEVSRAEAGGSFA